MGILCGCYLDFSKTEPDWQCFFYIPNQGSLLAAISLLNMQIKRDTTFMLLYFLATVSHSRNRLCCYCEYYTYCYRLQFMQGCMAMYKRWCVITANVCALCTHPYYPSMISLYPCDFIYTMYVYVTTTSFRRDVAGL